MTSEVDQLRATRSGSLQLAAARLVNIAGALMERALEGSGKKAREVARDMLVSEGRVSQLLAADGNVKLSTLARFMDACGYELSLEATPKDESARPIASNRRAPRRSTPPKPHRSASPMSADVTWIGHGTRVVDPHYLSHDDVFVMSADDLIGGGWNIGHALVPATTSRQLHSWVVRSLCHEGHEEAEYARCLYRHVDEDTDVWARD
jgi:hypothetical protein